MNTYFRFHRLPLADLAVIEHLPIADQRGFLELMFCSETFSMFGLRQPIMQIDRTPTRHS
jgi:hypothetical protein